MLPVVASILGVLILRPVAVRALWLWFLLRIGLLLLMTIAGQRGGVLIALPGRVSLMVIAIAVSLVFIDLHRRHERLLWANLGYSDLLLAAVASIPPLAAEVSLGVIGRLAAR